MIDLTERIADLQQTMQAVLEAPDLDPAAKGVAARVLLSQARQHPWNEGATRAVQWTVERDIDELVIGEDIGYGNPAERRVLELRRMDEDICKRCLLPLPSERTIRGWQQARMLTAIERDWMHRGNDGTAT